MKFPYGIANFQLLREEGIFYVDRTDRIALVEDTGYQLLFLRPRRFGKSLSTLENYYDLAKAEQFEALFGDLKIGKNPTPRRNSYFVLKLNFSGIDPHGNVETIAKNLHEHINSCIYGFNLHYRNYLPQPVECVESSLMKIWQWIAIGFTTLPSCRMGKSW